MNPRLEKAVSEFAATLTELARISFGDGTEFEAVPSGNTVKIEPAPWGQGNGGKAGFQFIPMRRKVDPPGENARLYLKVEFDVGLDDDEHQSLMVLHSTFGLWVLSDPARRPRPVARIEYDRDARSKPAAHVHLHAESVELGWIFGTAGAALPRQSEIHFPVGGRRFRPSLEELLLFLNDEGVFTDWADSDWREKVEASLDDWQQLQLRSAVRSQPDAAVQELARLGYSVTTPTRD